MSTTPAEPEFIDVDGERIALRQVAGATPGVMWLGGFKSDMLGTKAETLSDWAQEKGHAFIRHDYSGHGESGGRFVDGTISLWLKQSLEVLRRRTEGPQILVGSSMGAWIALRMVQELHRAGEGGRLAGLLLLAPAPDFTTDLMEPQLTDEQKRDLEEKGYFEEPSEYSPEPNVYTKALFDDGRANRVMTGLIDTHCPVHILQGMADPDVPYHHALRLVEHLPADDVTLSLIRDGDHRLSRPQDLAMIISALEGLIERTGQA
ncbi:MULTISPECIES: alpha/beta hydrolase [unclassified Aminobacter]|uniref:alpha/beta hydrolase n=1 Tax=unclassified Aminobacter TaxID=2644704 RepID=UPI0004639BDC|nr:MULTISPECIES: alpha/beta hydrolase [unclassified Aminobacter]TWG65533.1 alpha-beta hydrolase superfamily lysophospholipase [Aminobacter sp. J44]TWH30017.1 alpha-beta hydrolase superfamily lysophospholipase [Aminobacter sp. J15]